MSKEGGLVTRQEPDSCQLHVEFDAAPAVIYLYLYVTNTCDQRQSAVVESDDAGVLLRKECRQGTATNRRVG